MIAKIKVYNYWLIYNRYGWYIVVRLRANNNTSRLRLEVIKRIKIY